ncbi:hypothetical protein MSHOH_1054 [Methanosarcina horonobensis HB-1 = JCM 15518]|uniref:Uncharacterized protein n=1 Tax=Methanosarcina horonobensis HB-1 = JCM 15518 TaxID=1434110 RepID=A0A0E3SC83_9EURY|nr:hypothetical protein [Methanosarcina horonobensis]AKB77537.1 hypothetical protein MSHOH_1054 [Methanosarcina horonobensis HB-1 = JCM 15518]
MPIEFVLCTFEQLAKLPSLNLFNLLMLYLFSLFLPAVGLIVFMKNTRKTSSRWYWGILLLLGLILNTFLRDAMFMVPYNINAVNLVYGQPFIATFPILYKWHILERISPMNINLMFFISIFFSVAAALFCLSVPEEKRKKFMLPFVFSLIAVLSKLIQFIVQRRPDNPSLEIFPNETMSYYTFVIFSLAIFFLGLSFIEIAVNYEHVMPDAVKYK